MGFSVTGKVAPDIEKPVPDDLAEFTVTAAVPVDVSVTDCVAGVLSTTLPKARLVALRLNVEVPAAFNCNANVFVAPPAPAVSVAD